jgi:hypothetical protein
MVDTPNTTHSPEMGWRHFLAASSWSRPCSSPRPGGAANSGPITLKRKCAQCSWGRASDGVSLIGCVIFIFSTSVVVLARVLPPAAIRCRPASSAEIGTGLN